MKISNGLIWFLRDEVVQRLNEVINFLTGFLGQGCQDRTIKQAIFSPVLICLVYRKRGCKKKSTKRGAAKTWPASRHGLVYQDRTARKDPMAEQEG
jgi:hypothetical protein